MGILITSELIARPSSGTGLADYILEWHGVNLGQTYDATATASTQVGTSSAAVSFFQPGPARLTAAVQPAAVHGVTADSGLVPPAATSFIRSRPSTTSDPGALGALYVGPAVVGALSSVTCTSGAATASSGPTGEVEFNPKDSSSSASSDNFLDLGDARAIIVAAVTIFVVLAALGAALFLWYWKKFGPSPLVTPLSVMQEKRKGFWEARRAQQERERWHMKDTDALATTFEGEVQKPSAELRGIGKKR